MTPRTVEDYLKLPYTIEVIYDNTEGNSGWFASVVELPGCMTQAETFEELGPMVQDAMRGWIEVALEDGLAIPEPRLEEEYSGKFVTRVPRSLHRQLVEAADRDGVSLNACVNVALARAVGHPQPAVKADEPLASPAPSWPQLSSVAKRAMLAAGLAVEAQRVDEELFANWLVRNLQQVEAAIQINSMRDAVAHLDLCQQALGICRSASPLMSAFFQTVNLLEEQVREAGQLRAGLIQQSLIQGRISAQVQASSLQAMPMRMRPPLDLADKADELIREVAEGNSISSLFARGF